MDAINAYVTAKAGIYGKPRIKGLKMGLPRYCGKGRSVSNDPNFNQLGLGKTNPSRSKPKVTLYMLRLQYE